MGVSGEVREWIGGSDAVTSLHRHCEEMSGTHQDQESGSHQQFGSRFGVEPG